MIALVSRLLCRVSLGGIDLLVVVGVILPLFLGAMFKLHWFPHLIENGPLSLGVAIAIGCIALVPIIATLILSSRCAPQAFAFAFWGILFIALLLRIAWVLSVENSFGSDYLTMWQFVTDVVNGTRELDARIVQEMRTIPFLAPIGIWSGGNPTAFQLANAVTSMLTLVLVYYLAHLFGGAKAGILALGLAAFAPEPWFANEIPTHDVPGAFLMLAAITCLVVGIRSADKPNSSIVFFLWVCLGGAIVGIADVQRSVGPFIYGAFALSLLLWICIRNKTGNGHTMRKMAMAFAAMVLVVFAGGLTKTLLISSFADGAALEAGGQRAIWGWIASYAGPESVGEYGEYSAMKPYINAMDVDELPGFAFLKIASEYSEDPYGIIKHYVRKAERLYNLGRQGGEYYGNLQASRLVSGPGGAQRLRQILDAYTGIYAFALIFLAVFGVALSVFRQPGGQPASVLPLSVLALMSLALISIGEIQSRYINFAWLILPIYIGIAFARLERTPRHFEGWVLFQRVGVDISLAAGFSLFALIVVWFALVRYANIQGPFISAQHFNSSPEIVTTTKWSADVVDLERNEPIKVLKLGLEEVGDGRGELMFFASKKTKTGSACQARFEIRNSKSEQKAVYPVALTAEPVFVSIPVRETVSRQQNLWLLRDPESQYVDDGCNQVRISFARWRPARSVLE